MRKADLSIACRMHRQAQSALAAEAPDAKSACAHDGRTATSAARVATTRAACAARRAEAAATLCPSKCGSVLMTSHLPIHTADERAVE